MPNSMVELAKAPIMKSAIAFPVLVPVKVSDLVSARLNSNTGRMNS